MLQGEKKRAARTVKQLPKLAQLTVARAAQQDLGRTRYLVQSTDAIEHWMGNRLAQLAAHVANGALPMRRHIAPPALHWNEFGRCSQGAYEGQHKAILGCI